MKKLVRFLLLFLPLFASQTLMAQRYAVSTNAADYFNLCTINAEASFACAKQWTLTAGFRYNPFQFNRQKTGREFQNKTRTVAIGARYWPWHVYSGWWLSGNIQYQEYNAGGILSRTTREGDRYGGSLGFGYNRMLGRHFNLDLGLKIWAGMDRYREYECPVCGLTVDRGNRFFLLPDEILIAFSYVF